MSQSANAVRFALLTRFLKGEAKVPQMPEAALRIRRLLEDPRTSLEQLARVINSDPPLAAYLMQFADSPLLRGGRQGMSMRDLLARLGTRQLNDLVLGFTVRHLFASRETILQQAFALRWRRARERAAYCAALAQRCSLALDDAMLAGLLQDIGSLPLLDELQHWPDFPREMAALDELCDQLVRRHRRTGADALATACCRHRMRAPARPAAAPARRPRQTSPTWSWSPAPCRPTRPLCLSPCRRRGLGLQQPLAELREALRPELQLWLRLLA